jgi:TatD DNase family protein
LIDTHAHLDACDGHPGAVLERAREAGVTRVVTVGTGIESSRLALALADREVGVYATVGIHPHDAGTSAASRLEELRELLGHQRAVAVGETGLDHYRDYAPHDAQLRLFEDHLALAADVGLPVVIHTRAASRETAEVLADFTGDVVLHCFSEPELLEVALDRGYYVSFAGNVTYANAVDLREAARAVPEDRLLAETDCPYLAPQPVRGRRNEPAYIAHTFEALAALRGVRRDHLVSVVDANADRLFGLR